jgi:pyruvate/2-oxoglutarate dehydrogenase complex dihydrolipoamide dehydrogenase (E3) component
VIGGGAVGCELSQSFQRLGARVTQVEMLPRLLAREDPEVSAFVEARLRAEGVEVHTRHRAVDCEMRGEDQIAILEHEGTSIEVPFDTLLVAAGREARVEGFGLEEVGVRLRDGRVETDAYLRTRVPTIYACGDCVGPYQFTHAASHQAWHAAVNSLFSNPFRRFKVDYSKLPSTVYTDPEVARVGLTEIRAQEEGVAYEVTRYDMKEQDRAIAEESAVGFVKVLTPPGKDRILGAVIVGTHAGDLITEFTLAMKHGIGLNGILGTIHPYPTLAEANKAVAGKWKRENAPQRLLEWVRRYHDWRR